MIVRLISLRGVDFDGEAESLNIKTTSGEITVLDHHRPLIANLVKSIAKIEVSGGRTEILVEGGFLEVNDQNEVIALID